MDKSAASRLGRMGSVQRLALFLALSLLPASSLCQSDSRMPVSVLHIGFSAGMFTEVNRNDASASVKAWGNALANSKNIHVVAEANVYDKPDDIDRALKEEEVDVLGLPIREFITLSKSNRLDSIHLAARNDQTYEQYVLLTSKQNTLRDIFDIRNKRLAIHRNPRMDLAEIWLDTVLMEKGFPPTRDFVLKVDSYDKLSKTVLDVFFRKADLCLVTLAGFRTMAELNPQVGQELGVLIASPPFLPTIMCFRSSYQDSVRPKIIEAIQELHEEPAANQVLLIFQCDRVVPASADVLENTKALIEKHERLTHGVATNRFADSESSAWGPMKDGRPATVLLNAR